MTAQYYNRIHKGLDDIIADGGTIDGQITLSKTTIRAIEKKIDDLVSDIE
jgi:hypothetical protein